jgi:nucleotide-binding universal stress UspA family protein
MFKRVLTATDMLQACEAAVISALQIAKRNQGKLFILHVLEPSYFHECGPLETVRNYKTGEEIAASQEYREAVKNELDSKCSGYLKPYGDYEILISYGRPSIEIRRWSSKVGADLIVLGPHAGKVEEGFRGTVIGDTVEDVIMHTNIPVMIINRLILEEKLNFKKIMICIDFSRSCKHAFDFSVKLAKENNSKLFIFHMTHKADIGGKETTGQFKVDVKKLKEFYEVRENIQHEYCLVEGASPSLSILKYAMENDIDLIIMGSHTTDEEDKRWYVGSVVEKVSTQSLCPVVIVTHPVTHFH